MVEWFQLNPKIMVLNWAISMLILIEHGTVGIEKTIRLLKYSSWNPNFQPTSVQSGDAGHFPARAAIDTRYNRGYTTRMKTAISIPDKIYEAAEKAAKRLGVSRSEFYVNAIEEYLGKTSDENLTEELNKIYSNPESLSQSELDPTLQHMQKQSIGHGEW
jgi:predicted DNA-binding protein